MGHFVVGIRHLLPHYALVFYSSLPILLQFSDSDVFMINSFSPKFRLNPHDLETNTLAKMFTPKLPPFSLQV